MKKRARKVKGRQLSLLFSLMIIGILVLIALVFVYNYNKTSLNKNLKGELRTEGVFESNSIATHSTDDIIMKLSSSTNSHGALWNDANYQTNIYYSDVFGWSYYGTNPHNCNGNFNKVVGLYSSTNAHAEIPSLNNYGTNVCYGDLICRGVSGTCNSDEKSVVALASNTNSHLSSISNVNYPVNICCKTFGCSNDSQCSVNTPKCNPIGKCVQCIDNSNCAYGYNCNLATGNCTQETDTTVPVISSISLIITNNSANITWNTNEASNSSVNYGNVISDLNNTVIDSSFVLNHSVLLSNLINFSTYYYSIRSCDGYGNCASKGVYSFTTLNNTDDSNQTNTSVTTTRIIIPSFVNDTDINIITKMSVEERNAAIGDLIEITASSEGLNQSKVIFGITNLPSGARFDSKTGKFSWTPGSAGEYTINFSATDGKIINLKIIKISVGDSGQVSPDLPVTLSPDNIGKIIFWIIAIIIGVIILVMISILVVLASRRRKLRKQSAQINRNLQANPN